MTSKTTNKFSPEVRARAVRLVQQSPAAGAHRPPAEAEERYYATLEEPAMAA
jgi:hypothetical protein